MKTKDRALRKVKIRVPALAARGRSSRVKMAAISDHRGAIIVIFSLALGAEPCILQLRVRFKQA
jgi:hypothetical protein